MVDIFDSSNNCVVNGFILFSIIVSSKVVEIIFLLTDSVKGILEISWIGIVL